MTNYSVAAILQILKWIGNTLFHQIVAVLTVYAIWIPIENYIGTLSWHVILSTIGILPLMAEALILFSDNNVWSQELDKLGRRWLHVILIILSSVFILLGISVEIGRKSQTGDSHFSSSHAILGLICVIFIFFGLIFGILVGMSSIFREMVAPVWFKIGHNISGQLSYIMGLVCLILGFYTDWFASYTSETSRYTATAATAIIIVWSLVSSWQSLYRHFKSTSPY